jgi:hypothetical protein
MRLEKARPVQSRGDPVRLSERVTGEVADDC